MNKVELFYDHSKLKYEIHQHTEGVPIMYIRG